MIKPSPSAILCREFIGVKISNLLADQMQFQGCLLVDHCEADIGETNMEDNYSINSPSITSPSINYPSRWRMIRGLDRETAILLPPPQTYSRRSKNPPPPSSNLLEKRFQHCKGLDLELCHIPKVFWQVLLCGWPLLQRYFVSPPSAVLCPALVLSGNLTCNQIPPLFVAGVNKRVPSSPSFPLFQFVSP